MEHARQPAADESVGHALAEEVVLVEVAVVREEDAAQTAAPRSRQRRRGAGRGSEPERRLLEMRAPAVRVQLRLDTAGGGWVPAQQGEGGE